MGVSISPMSEILGQRSNLPPRLIPSWTPKMTEYDRACLYRPLAVLLAPTALLMAAIADQLLLAVILLMGGGLLARALGCKRCAYSVYADKRNLFRTMLCTPQRVCTNCGNRNDAADPSDDTPAIRQEK